MGPQDEPVRTGSLNWPEAFGITVIFLGVVVVVVTMILSYKSPEVIMLPPGATVESLHQ